MSRVTGLGTEPDLVRLSPCRLLLGVNSTIDNNTKQTCDRYILVLALLCILMADVSDGRRPFGVGLNGQQFEFDDHLVFGV